MNTNVKTAIVVAQAVPGTLPAIKKARRRRSDLIFILVAPQEDPEQIARYADLALQTDDLMRGLGEPVQSGREGNVPRMGYRCADGALRLVFPEERWIPLAPGEPEPFIAYDPKRGKYSRDPLVMYDVDPVTFKYSNRRVLFDAPAQAPAIATPAADLVTLTPAGDNKQWLLFRVKDRDAKKQGTPAESLQAMGCHSVELSY